MDVKLPSLALLLRCSLALLCYIPWLLPPTAGLRKSLESLSSADSHAAAVEERQSHYCSIRWGFLGGIPLCIGMIFQTICLTMSSSQKVALWCSLYVILTPLLQGCFSKYIPLRHWVAAVCAFGGVFFFEYSSADGGTSSQFISSLGWGSLTAFLQAVFFAICYVIVSNGMLRYPDKATPFTAGMMVACTAGAALWTLLEFISLSFINWQNAVVVWHDALASLADWHVLLNLVWTSIVTFAVTALGENWALGRLSAVEHIVILSTTPIWSGIAALAVDNIPLTVQYCVGAALSIVGVVVCQVDFCPHKKKLDDEATPLV